MQKVLALVALGVVWLAPTARGQGQEDARAVVRILDDRALWGEDFYRLLVSLPGFPRAREPRIVLFPDRVVGAGRYQRPEAEGRVPALATALQGGGDQRFATAVRRRYRVQQSIALQPAAFELLEDRTFRVAALAPEARFLPPGLAVATVLERLGPPERVTTQTIDDGTERRPTVLTLYRYAGGAIAFAESDIAARPGLVSRVFLDVPAITSALLQEVQP